MTELSTAPPTGPGNSSPDGTAPPQDAGLTPATPATASASTVLAQLELCGWKSLHSLTTKDKASLVIDHLAVGPGGIFVIDAHSWTPALSTTVGPEQQTIIAASDALANQVRTLLPPLSRQYVVPLLTYVDASPMSMVRGSLHICTTSMLQGVITSRRPVLNDAEIDDVLTSLSSTLRSSPGAASATAPPSAAPTRRGFLRKNSRASASSGQPTEVAPAPTPSVASAVPRDVALPIVATEPPPEPAAVAPTIASPVATAAQLTEPSHDGEDPFALPAAPSVADFLAGEAEAALRATPEHDPVIEQDSDPALVTTEPPATSTALVDVEIEDLAHPVIPTDTHWDLETEPELDPAIDAAFDADIPTVDVEIEDLAHPVIPTDTHWDLEIEPELDPMPVFASQDAETDADSVTEAFDQEVIETQEVLNEAESIADATPVVEAIVVAPAVEPAPKVESVQPTLAAAALTPAVAPPSAPTAPRQPGGRRKAPAKAGLSRLIPSRPARASGRSSRRTADSDGDGSQEPDLGDLTEDIALADPQSDEGWDALESDDGFGDYQFDDFEPTASSQAADQPRQQIRTTDVIARSALPQDEPRQSKKSRLRRKKKDHAEIEDDDIDLSEMPANLSERGRAMYVELQRRPKPEPTRVASTQTGAGKAGAIRKLFVFCVIGGAIGITSSNYEQINTWVSTHVEDLPGLQKIEGPPQPEKPIKAKNAKNKPGKGAKAGNARQ